MTIHYLKTVQPYYDSVVRGEKPFEVRKNDRNFQVGDIVCLKEYQTEPIQGKRWAKKPEYTGREIWKKIVYMTDYRQQVGFVVFAIRNLNLAEEEVLNDLIEKEAMERFDALVCLGKLRELGAALGRDVSGSAFALRLEQYSLDEIIKACDVVEAES